MVFIQINHFKFLLKSTLSILESCQFIGIQLPRFCYHEVLSIAGNCRMCLVEIDKSPKPIIACAMPITNNMVIFTNSPQVKKARENVLELLLINHPLDCPICDQGGECDLQDQTKNFGGDSNRYYKKKRFIEDKNFGVSIKTIMTRCIHCTRCVRFSDELTNSFVFGTLNRGGNMEIGSYVKALFDSEISGNIVDLCPVGALTFKRYSFKARPWELKTQETLDCTDSFGSNILVNFKETEILRIQPKIVKNSNNSFISDKIRYLVDAISNNRIKNIFKKKNNTFSVFDFENFKIEFFNQVNLKKNFLVVVDDNIDIETLQKLKSLQSNQITVASISNKSISKNFYFNSFFFNKSTIIEKKKIKFFFILSVNLQTESIILNTKLRIKFNKEEIKFFSSGIKNNLNFPTFVINIDIIKSISIFEGKSIFSLNLRKIKSSLLLIGNSFQNRIKNIFYFLSIYKNFCSNNYILNIGLNSNSEGIQFLGLKNFSTKFLKENQNFLFLNLEDMVYVRKFFQKITKEKKIFWFNTHGSFIAQKSDYIIPTPTFFEIEKYFINNDFVMQKTQRVLIHKESFDFSQVLIEILKKTLKKNFIFFFYDFKKENISLVEIFFKNFNLFNEKCFTFILKYPITSVVEDFFLTSIITKNSKFLLKRSKEKRKVFNSFKSLKKNDF